MSGETTNLGVCYSANQLYYAVNDPSHPGFLRHIGSVDFNFDVSNAIQTQHSDYFPGIKTLLSNLYEQFDVDQLRILTPPHKECWTSFPKLVYDKSDEREAHLSILMKGMNREDQEPTWFPLSNQDFKFLLVRNKRVMSGFEKLASDVSGAEYVSDFELGGQWTAETGTKGSFLTVSCYPQTMAIASYVLGKLRGATYISFDDPEDLPYLWLQYADNLKWMGGIHDQIYVYGYDAYRFVNILEPFWDDAAAVHRMNSLDEMQVTADETTYGFALDAAFPSILMALNPAPANG
jgi:hypothetical protein